MFEIIEKKVLVPSIIYMKVRAPEIAAAAQPGQFVMLRVDEIGERFPMSLAGWDKDEGTVDITFYVLGTSTVKLATLKEGESILNMAGPLGKPTEVDSFGRVICACGCFGIGPTLPLVKALKEKGCEVITVVEARSREAVFWEDRLREASDEVHLVLGDGSGGGKCWTDDYIGHLLRGGTHIDRIFVHGCPFMMMKCAETSRGSGVKTIVSLLPMMVDGTGMCGACRVEVGGETRFACVDGPDFDGHEVNWDGHVLRLRHLTTEESRSYSLWERENWHKLMDISPKADLLQEREEHQVASKKRKVPCKIQLVF